MDTGTVFKRNQNAAYRIYDGKATVVTPDGGGSVDVLNEIGSLVWESIDGRRTVEQVVEAVLGTVVNDYEVAPEQVRRDILEFIETLRDHGMVD